MGYSPEQRGGEGWPSLQIDKRTNLSIGFGRKSPAVPAYGDYDVSPDGRSIALIRPFDLARGREVVLAINRLA
jgi:hypothetical protein